LKRLITYSVIAWHNHKTKDLNVGTAIMTTSISFLIFRQQTHRHTELLRHSLANSISRNMSIKNQVNLSPSCVRRELRQLQFFRDCHLSIWTFVMLF